VLLLILPVLCCSGPAIFAALAAAGAMTLGVGGGRCGPCRLGGLSLLPPGRAGEAPMSAARPSTLAARRALLPRTLAEVLGSPWCLAGFVGLSAMVILLFIAVAL